MNKNSKSAVSSNILSVKEMKSTKPVMIDNNSMLVPTKLIHGQYANKLLCTHYEKAFVLDFASVLPGVETPRVNSRIIVSAEKMKSFIDAMTSTYNAVYGKQKVGGNSKK